MSSVFSLDSIREEAQKKYAPITLDLGDGVEVELRSLVRLPKKDREKAYLYLEAIQTTESGTASGVDNLADNAVKLLTTVADQGGPLAKALGDDLALILEVLAVWMDGSQPGGSRVLADLIDEFGEAIIPDLLDYYRFDLRELFSEDPPSPRWVLNLIMHLPLKSRFNAARRGGQKYHGWDAQAYALADIANSLRSMVFLYTSANRDPKKSKMPKVPKPFPTPDTEDQEQQTQKPNLFRQMVLQSKTQAQKKAGT